MTVCQSVIQLATQEDYAMLLTPKTDKPILQFLRHCGNHAQAILTISRGIHKPYAQTYKRIKILTKAGILQPIGKSPALYMISFEERQHPAQFVTAECPKCGATKTVYENQSTTMCCNSNCFTRMGKRTRYWL